MLRTSKTVVVVKNKKRWSNIYYVNIFNHLYFQCLEFERKEATKKRTKITWKEMNIVQIWDHHKSISKL
jgi:hypothetical protein